MMTFFLMKSRNQWKDSLAGWKKRQSVHWAAVPKINPCAFYCWAHTMGAVIHSLWDYPISSFPFYGINISLGLWRPLMVPSSSLKSSTPIQPDELQQLPPVKEMCLEWPLVIGSHFLLYIQINIYIISIWRDEMHFLVTFTEEQRRKHSALETSWFGSATGN